jgi:hypothetical protein
MNFKENNKVFQLSSGSQLVSECEKDVSPYFAIILGLLASLICGYILFITTRIIYEYIYHNYFFCLLIGANCFTGLLIGTAISYGINKNKYSNKKVLFILVLLCSFLTYLICNIALYYDFCIDVTDVIGFSGFIHFLKNTVLTKPLEMQQWCISGYSARILQFYDFITLGKLYINTLVRIINIQVWIIELIITIYCAWLFIIITCPWLLPQRISSIGKRFYTLFIKERKQKYLFLLLVLLIVIIIYGIIQYISISNSKLVKVYKIPDEFAEGDLEKIKKCIRKDMIQIRYDKKIKINIFKVKRLKWLVNKNFSSKEELTMVLKKLDFSQEDISEILNHTLTKTQNLINAIDDFGTTPLHIAARHGKKEVVEFLIFREADINAKEGMNGLTPLHEAVLSGSLEIVKLLVVKGAYINVRNFSGGTPLHLAVWHKNKKVVEFLISRGADINAKKLSGDTPLLCALTGQLTSPYEKELIEFLISRGADVNIENLDGKTPLEIVGENSDIGTILIKHGAKR